jgi:hypothetical protein
MVEPPAHSDRPAEDGPTNDRTPICYGSLAVSIMTAALLGGAASAASACDMAVSTIVLPLAGIWGSRRRM